jgi:hypothetical protein
VKCDICHRSWPVEDTVRSTARKSELRPGKAARYCPPRAWDACEKRSLGEKKRAAA